jgi:hypothetical protein
MSSFKHALTRYERAEGGFFQPVGGDVYDDVTEALQAALDWCADRADRSFKLTRLVPSEWVDPD